MRMRGGAHHAGPVLDTRRTCPLVVAEMHTIVLHVAAMVLAASLVAFGHRLDAEAVTAHGATASAHAVALAHCAAFTTDFAARGVRCVLRHFVTSMMLTRIVLRMQGNRYCLILGFACRSLATNVL